MKSYFLIWIALIKIEILITTGMALWVSSDKWKAPKFVSKIIDCYRDKPTLRD